MASNIKALEADLKSAIAAAVKAQRLLNDARFDAGLRQTQEVFFAREVDALKAEHREQIICLVPAIASDIRSQYDKAYAATRHTPFASYMKSLNANVIDFPKGK